MLLDVQLFAELLVVADLLPLASALVVLHFVSSFYSGSQPGLGLLRIQSLSAKLLQGSALHSLRNQVHQTQILQMLVVCS